MASQKDPRLYPSRTSSRYIVLTGLRRALQLVIRNHVEDAGYSRALDVGAGSAPYRALIAPHVDRYCTADLPGQGADYEVSREGRVPLADESVGLVVSSQVLEHVEDPIAHLRELRRLLSPSGTVVLSTHGHWMYHPTPVDYWRWTGPGLRHLMEGAGFRVLETVGVVGRAGAGLQLLHDGLSLRVPTFLRPLVAAGFQGLIAVADWLDPTERSQDACVFVVAARKLEQ